jgi:cytochrome P450
MTSKARTTHEIPLISGAPLVGSAGELQRDMLGFLLRLSREGHPICRFEVYGQQPLFINSPEVLHEILVEKARHFGKPLGLKLVFYPLTGEGLFASNGELWRRQRKIMAPIFQPGQLAHYAASMAACAQRGAATWRDGQRIDVAREMTRITMSVVGKTLFDADTFDEADELGAAMNEALRWSNAHMTSLSLIAREVAIGALRRRAGALHEKLRAPAGALIERLHYPVLPTRDSRRLKRAVTTLDRRIAQMIAERRGSGLTRLDLLTTLLRARDEQGEAMSDKQVRDEAMTLFGAGHETTATALTWALYLLDRHPESRQKVVEEADRLGGRLPSYEDLPRLPYALMVFKEAMRLYPPIHFSPRVSVDEVEVGGHRIPAGSGFWFSPYAMHRRPDLWPEPDRFLPERFTSDAESARPRHAYIPFGGGPRVCIGNHFALMEGQILLATLAQRATLSLIPGTPVVGKPAPVLRPEHGLPMRVELRGGDR